MSDSLRPHGLQHARAPCPSPTPGVYSNSCPLSQWCHPAISSSVGHFFCLQSFPASGSFPVSQFFTSGGQSIGVSASASVLPMNIQDWFPLGASVHHLLNVATQEYLPTELQCGSSSRCPAHRKCWVSISSAPWLQDVTEPALVDMGGCWQAPVSPTQHGSGSPQILSIPTLQYAGRIWGSYPCRAGESRKKDSTSPFVFKVSRKWEVSRDVLREKPEPEMEVDWQGTNKGKPRQHIIKQSHCFTNKGLSSQSYDFSSSHVWMWELDY